MMCVPQAFCANPQTMATNTFQTHAFGIEVDTQAQALRESHALCLALVQAGVVVTHYRGQAGCPDDLFCNNWVSTHADGSVFTYPMHAPNRQLERRADVLTLLWATHPDYYDLSVYAAAGQALESTGSLVLDRINRRAYVALSARADAEVLQDWAHVSGYDLTTFRTQTRSGGPVYHTNVMLFIGTGYAGLCADIIVPEDRARVIAALQATHDAVLISEDQMQHFCGNALEVQNTDGARFLVMSSTAYHAFAADQVAAFKRHVTDILHADLKTIEAHGGGSARCMLLEVF